MLKPKIIWDYASRPGLRDEVVALVSLTLPDESEMILLYNNTTNKIHLSHDGNWGYISYVDEARADKPS